MGNNDILNYLKSGIKSGKSIPELKGNLISNGWDKHEIDLAVLEFLKSNPILNDNTSIVKNNTAENEEVFNLENIKAEKPKIIYKEPTLVSNPIVQKKIFYKKWIIIVGCILLLFLLLFLIFFNNNVAAKNNFVDVSNGTIVKFLKNNMNIKINDTIVSFKITGVDEYIVHYYIEGIKGDLAMKEEIKINLTEGEIDNITLRLDKIENKIPYIYIRA